MRKQSEPTTQPSRRQPHGTLTLIEQICYRDAKSNGAIPASAFHFIEQKTMSQLSNDPQANYRLFIDQICADGLVWGIATDEGWVVCDSEEYEDTDVIPFWSAEADAKAHCSGEWSAFEPQSITLTVFVERWLTGMADDGVLAGPNWNDELVGLEVEPADLAKALLD